jgi:hypothetical protein
MREHPSHPAKRTASRRAELLKSPQEMVADCLPNNAASLQRDKLDIPVGIPAADDYVSVRGLSDEPELSFQKDLELTPFLAPATFLANAPTYAHTTMLTGGGRDANTASPTTY